MNKVFDGTLQIQTLASSRQRMFERHVLYMHYINRNCLYTEDVPLHSPRMRKSRTKTKDSETALTEDRVVSIPDLFPLYPVFEYFPEYRPEIFAVLLSPSSKMPL